MSIPLPITSVQQGRYTTMMNASQAYLEGLGAKVTWPVVVTPAPVPVVAPTLLGWSGAAVVGGTNAVVGTWMARDTWQRLARGEWMQADADYSTFVAAHPDRAADVGVPLVPLAGGLPVATLLDMVAANAALTGVADSQGSPITSTDGVFTAMGARLATLGPQTVFARLLWEYNLVSGIDQARFVAAWNHAVPLIRAGFASAARTGQKLRVVFCPLISGAGSNWATFYPGDATVDIIAGDVYGQVWGTTTPTVTALLASVNGSLNELSAFAATRGKPVALGEWANVSIKPQGVADSQGRGDCPEYIDAVRTWCKTHGAVYAVYYNITAAGVGQTLANTPLSLARLLAA